MYSNKFIDEFPHEVTVKRIKVEEDRTVYPPVMTETKTEHTAQVFLDTPSSRERTEYHNLNIQLDRNMYAPFGVDINDDDIIIYDSEEYKFVGKLEDQGGQKEILKAPMEMK